MTVLIQFRSASPRPASRREVGPAADPHGFTRILMDGALERIEAAREQFLEGGPAERRRLLQATLLLVGELRAELDLREGGTIAANVDDLYDYIIRRLKAADMANGSAALAEVSHLLEALRAAWPFMPAEVRAAPRN